MNLAALAGEPKPTMTIDSVAALMCEDEPTTDDVYRAVTEYGVLISLPQAHDIYSAFFDRDQVKVTVPIATGDIVITAMNGQMQVFDAESGDLLDRVTDEPFTC